MKFLVGLFLCLGWTTGLLGEEQKGIRVTGEGRVTVVPDQIEFRVGAEFEGKSAQTIKERSDALMRKLMAETKAFGIDPKDVSSENIRISRSYSEDDKPESRTYMANAELRIFLRDVSKYDALVEKMFRSGANKMSDVVPGSTKMETLRDQARVNAINDAKRRAQKIAEEFKVKLGKVHSVVETRGDGMPALYRGAGGSAKMDMAPTVALGELEQTVTIEVVFDID